MSAPDPSAQALRDAFAALKKAAIDEADRAVEAYRRRTPQRFWSSRMNQRALDDLKGAFTRAWPDAIASRLAQLDHLNRKLARSDPGWTLLTPEQLRAVPAFTYTGRSA